MSLSKRRAATLIVFLCLGSAAFGVWIYPQVEATYFSQALAYVHETVSLQGRSYTISNGTVESEKVMSARASLPVLKLAYRKAMAERNPLLAVAGTDPQKLMRAVSDLQSTAQQLAAIQSEAQRPQEDHLYPIKFLTELARLEQDRLTFADDGSETSADAYDLQMKQTIAAYQQDLADFKTAFKMAVPATIKKYATARSIVFYDALLSALGTFSGGIERTKGTAYGRAQCVSGLIWYCSSSDLSLPSIPVRRQESGDTTETSRAIRVRSIYADAMKMPQLNDLPLIGLADSTCVSDVGSALFTIRPTTPPQHGMQSFSYPIYVGDLRLIDSSSQASIPFLSYFAAHDIRYVPASPIDYYECPTVAEDIGTVRSIQSIIELAKTEPLSAYASGTDARDLMALETKLAGHGDLVLERDALAYAQVARSLIIKNTLPEHVSDRVVSILLRVRDQSAQFDTLIDTISLTERGNLYLKHNGVPVALDPTYLFFLRSGVFALFMAHNPSVIGTHGPLLPPNTISAAVEPYVYYRSLPRSSQTDREMIKDLRFFTELHRP